MANTDIDDSLEALKKYRSKIRVVDQLVQNDVSSTKVLKPLSS